LAFSFSFRLANWLSESLSQKVKSPTVFSYELSRLVLTIVYVAESVVHVSAYCGLVVVYYTTYITSLCRLFLLQYYNRPVGRVATDFCAEQRQLYDR